MIIYLFKVQFPYQIAAQDVFDSADCSKDGWWEIGFPHSLQKWTPLSIFGYGADVKGLGEVLCQVNTGKCCALDDLHRVSVDV